MAKRLNLHIDESGNQGLSEGRYLIAVVLHDHFEGVDEAIARYEARLLTAGLPDIPFHGKDLLHGNEEYAVMSPGDRKRLLTHDALDFVLAKNVASYRDTEPNARRLLQVADYICTVVRIAGDYNAGRQSKTHERFFGSRRNFMQSFMKQLNRKGFA